MGTIFTLEPFPTAVRVKPLKGKNHLTDDLVITDEVVEYPNPGSVVTLCGKALDGATILGPYKPRRDGIDEDMCLRCRDAVDGHARTKRLTR